MEVGLARGVGAHDEQALADIELHVLEVPPVARRQVRDLHRRPCSSARSAYF